MPTLSCALLVAFAQLFAPWAMDPATGKWRALSSVGAPAVSESGFTWSKITVRDSKVYAIGTTRSGENLSYAGAVYDIARDTWTPVSFDSAPAPRLNPVAEWMLERLYIMGGEDAATRAPIVSGGFFDPQTGKWHTMSANGMPKLIHPQTSWVGEKLLLWGEAENDPLSSRGYLYDPRNDSWTSIADIASPVPSRINLGAWTGERQLFWGTSSEFGCMSSGAFYSLAENRWESVSSVGAPRNCRSAITAWVDGRIFVWGGQVESEKNQFEWVNTGGVYDSRLRTWKAVNAHGAPLVRADTNRSYRGTWFGDEFLAFRFDSDNKCSGFCYDVSEDEWKPISLVPAKEGERNIWIDRFEGELRLFEFRYDPARDALTACHRHPLPPVDPSRIKGETLIVRDNAWLLFFVDSPVS
jgi:hypothetical protein